MPLGSVVIWAVFPQSVVSADFSDYCDFNESSDCRNSDNFAVYAPADLLNPQMELIILLAQPA